MEAFTVPIRNVTRQLVLNWHLTETCNYSCRYCYSSWQKPCLDKEIFRNPEFSERLLSELFRFFRADNAGNPLRKELRWQGVRLSLAGGEPLLYPKHILRIGEKARSLGFDLSLITNGSLLTWEVIPPLAKNLSMLGISLDSADSDTNRKIGRIDRAGRTICLDDLTEMVDLARACNPDLQIKINTVVNVQNADEDLTEMIRRLQPDKWKVLRALPIVTTDLAVTDQKFRAFLERHRHLGKLLSAEDNQDMTESYLMVDPYGRFFQNKASSRDGSPYIYSQAILDVGAEATFAQVNFDAKKFAGRYSISGEGETA